MTGVSATDTTTSGRSRNLLDADRLMREAEAESGLSAWGDPPFQEPLDRLLASARDEAKLEGQAEQVFANRIRSLMVKRLQLYRDRARYPEIALQKIVAPMIVIGLPRSGTTILHAALAQDPEVRSPMRWEIEHPSPPPRQDTFFSDPRIAETQAEVDAMPAAFRAMHAMGAEMPEECNSFMTMAFLSSGFGAAIRLPSYMHWLIHEADLAPGFALHRHVLQQFQAFTSSKRWALKSPTHLMWVEAMMAAYPDARVVVTHRDPAQVLPSNASLIAFLRGADEEGRRLAGKDAIDEWGAGLRKTMEYRGNNAHADQFFDILYADFMRNPIDVIDSIYRHFGMILTDEARSRMGTYLKENQQGKSRKHHYNAADFGIDPAKIHEDFRHYIEAYNIPVH